jgi:hypothetical protein
MFKPSKSNSTGAKIYELRNLTERAINAINAMSRLYGETTLRTAYEVLDILREMQSQLTDIRTAYNMAVDELELRKDARTIDEDIPSAGEEGDIPF